MAYTHTKFNTAVNNISQLSDLPNDTDGLTAAQLKAKYDKAGTDIKDYLNNTLVPELQKRIYVLPLTGGNSASWDENIGYVIPGVEDAVPYTLTDNSVVVCQPAKGYVNEFRAADIYLTNYGKSDNTVTFYFKATTPAEEAFPFNLVIIN